jgi:ElaB/YqjD/DUF883 family membrane-anchored ribosome-binding protein
MKNASSSELTGETHTPEEIVEQISRLMSEAEALLVGPIADRSGEKMNDLRSRFSALQERAGDLYGSARRKVIAGARAADTTIRSHPYESLAVALGVGVLLGALIRRSTSS